MQMMCSDSDPSLFLFSYDGQLEDILDQAYEQYVTRKEGSSKHRKRAKRAHSKDDGDLLKVRLIELLSDLKISLICRIYFTRKGLIQPSLLQFKSH